MLCPTFVTCARRAHVVPTHARRWRSPNAWDTPCLVVEDEFTTFTTPLHPAGRSTKLIWTSQIVVTMFASMYNPADTWLQCFTSLTCWAQMREQLERQWLSSGRNGPSRKITCTCTRTKLFEGPLLPRASSLAVPTTCWVHPCNHTENQVGREKFARKDAPTLLDKSRCSFQQFVLQSMLAFCISCESYFVLGPISLGPISYFVLGPI